MRLNLFSISSKYAHFFAIYNRIIINILFGMIFVNNITIYGIELFRLRSTHFTFYISVRLIHKLNLLNTIDENSCDSYLYNKLISYIWLIEIKMD